MFENTFSSTHQPGIEQNWWQDVKLFGDANTPHSEVTYSIVHDYQFAEKKIRVHADKSFHLEYIETYYGECLIEQESADEDNIQCYVNGSTHSGIVSIRFVGASVNLEAITLRMLHPPPDTQQYGVMPSNFSNWTLFGHLKDPVAAVRDQCLLYERSKVPPNFLAELLVAVTLDDQSNIIAIHAAALEIQNVGIVLTGPSRAGKTTTSMHLAERGHALLGDEISAIRLTARELIPFRKSISLRSGPRSAALALTLSNMPVATNKFESDKIGPYRIDRLFPDNMVNPVRLSAIFFLSGKANKASCEPFQLQLDDTEVFNYMAANDAVAVSWGLNPVQRSLRLLALYQLIERIPSWKIIIGDPDSTAKLIEKCAIDSLGEKYDTNR